MVAQLDSLYIKTRPTKVVSRLISYGLFEGRPLTTGDDGLIHWSLPYLV